MALIAEVAYQTPQVRHWLPTRELPTVNAYLRAYGPLPSNLRVRASAAMIGAPIPSPEGIGTGSGIHRPEATLPPGVLECGAWTRNGHCGPCRACWDVSAVSYRAH
jgi:hypothetical protein